MLEDLLKNIQAQLGPLSSLTSIKKMLEAIPEKTYEGSSAGNFVKVKMTNRLEIDDIEIEIEMLKEKNKYLLEEMLAATINELSKKVLDAAEKDIMKMLSEKSKDMPNMTDSSSSASPNPNFLGNFTVKDPSGKELNIDLSDLKGGEGIFSDILNAMTKDGTPMPASSEEEEYDDVLKEEDIEKYSKDDDEGK